MAYSGHIDIIKQGVGAWNAWRDNNPNIRPDLSREFFREVDFDDANLEDVNFRGADLQGASLKRAKLGGACFQEANLTIADLRGASLKGCEFGHTIITEKKIETKICYSGADLSGADLGGSDFREVDFRGAELSNADLSMADLRGVDLKESSLSGANLSMADLSGADLSGADLMRATLIETNLERANLTGCRIYGISAWNIKLHRAKQSDLIITPNEEPTITVDNLEVAQFIYLMLHNEKIRDIINTIGRKGVLILGRFVPIERKAVLEAIRGKLRQLDYVPIVFDFEKPKDRDFTETIMILAGMCKFIISDITNPKSSPLELEAILPNYMIPLVPIIQEGEKPFVMFNDLANKYDWVLKPVIAYDGVPTLISVFEEAIIEPALDMHDRLMAKKTEELSTKHVNDFMSSRKNSI